MKSETNDIYEMLDILALPVAAQRFAQLSESPELGSYTALQFIREVLEPQYIETLNKRFETNLRLSSLILKTGNGRIYNDATVEQVLKFHFAENRQNVGIYGVTGAGKSYFLSACCVEACKRNYRCKFVDYSDLLDELIVLNRQEDLSKYRKRIRYYARIQLLFIDDFAISRYSEEGIKILYHLIKLRDDLGTSTLFTCQYSPDEWGNQLSDLLSVLLVSKAVRLIWPGLSGKCGPAVRRKWLFAIVWAWADEATKPLVQGRHFSWFDVGLNVLGIAIGMIAVILIF